MAPQEAQEPPPYESTPADTNNTKQGKQPLLSAPQASSLTTHPLFCCPFNTTTNIQNDSQVILTYHGAWEFRMLGPQTDTAIHGKYNRFFLWAGHGICRPHTFTTPSGIKPAVPWVYMIEVLDYGFRSPRDSGSDDNSYTNPRVQYFVAKAERGKGGFESLPYGKGNGVRMTNLAMKASIIMKCVEHGNWFEVNFYC